MTAPTEEQWVEVLGDRCIVARCSNHKSQGRFVGDLCAPCHHYITTGRIGATDSFLGELTAVRSIDWLESLKKRLVRISIKLHPDKGTMSNKEACEALDLIREDIRAEMVRLSNAKLCDGAK